MLYNLYAAALNFYVFGQEWGEDLDSAWLDAVEAGHSKSLCDSIISLAYDKA